MAKNIDPKLKKIGDYLTLEESSIFSIPEYQRAYSWEIKQCDKLWQDIENFKESEGTDPYFFGTIIINCQDDDTKLSLIDGQQRTTTFILLCKALLLRILKAIAGTDNDNDSKNLNMALTLKRNRLIKMLYKVSDNDLYPLLEDLGNAKENKILENNSINELYKDELQTIIHGKDFETIEEDVVKIKYKQKDNKYTNFFRNFKFFYDKLEDLSPSDINVFTEYILDKSEIIEIRSWNVEQAISMFNSLNSDGMPLLDSDIISAKLYSNSKDSREKFNKNWSELMNVVSDLEKNKVTDIDGVLMQYMYIKRSIDKAYISDKGAISVTTPGLRRYYTEINRQLLEDPLDFTYNLLKISKIWLEIKDYSIVELCSKFNENFKLYLISYLYRFEPETITENKINEFADSLLKLFSILELVDTGYSSSKFKTFLFGLNIKLVDRNIDVSEINQSIQDHINKEWSREEIKNSALNYTKNSLVFLNEYLVCKENSEDFDLTEKYEIEHIMPSSGKNIDQIREDAGIDNREEFLEVVNKLGNKTLLEENINRSIGNAWFRTKIQNSIKDKRGYKDSRFVLTKQILSEFEGQENPLWTLKDIEERTDVSAERIIKYIFGENL